MEQLGILVDKDDLINYQLVISYELLMKILIYQPTVDKTIVLCLSVWNFRFGGVFHAVPLFHYGAESVDDSW